MPQFTAPLGLAIAAAVTGAAILAFDWAARAGAADYWLQTNWLRNLAAIAVFCFSFERAGGVLLALGGGASGGRGAAASRAAAGKGADKAGQASAAQEARYLCSADELASHGLGPVAVARPAGKAGAARQAASARDLYLDMVKRALLNVIYCESSPAVWRYGSARKYELAYNTDRPFDLGARVRGEDVAANALTMVGLKRLGNIQHCLEEVLRTGVPGDFVETGACKGGACIFARAVLKAHGVTDRKVVACDTFNAPDDAGTGVLASVVSALVKPVVAVVALLCWPLKPVRVALFNAVQRLQSSFPPVDDPSPELVYTTFWMMKHLAAFPRPAEHPSVEPGLAAVKSHFARFGLLDDQVVFLQGFFSATLTPGPNQHPDAPARVAVLRADGDTYESTIDALESCYPKLQPGGFCIIDDYYSFVDCARAVDEYRAKHGITAEMHRIDNMSLYWQA